MGELKNKSIIQTRTYHNPNRPQVPPYDYDYNYPITVYEAVKQSMDDNAPNLADELAAIYRLIENKQNVIQGGTPGRIMTWTGLMGEIGELDVTRAINRDTMLQSHNKVPTERAVGDMLNTKASVQELDAHVNDRSIHVTDVERSRWNSMAPMSSLQSHIGNQIMHVTNEERKRWNQKADASIVDTHVYNTNNPHNVTAHQVGTYTRKEVDDLFKSIRESFFNYLNIVWDDRTNTAKLAPYDPANWNPNYILGFKDTLPDVPDPAQIYFALKPATDYSVTESPDVVIHVKKPGLAWQEVGSTTMKAGDMVIKFPDTRMYVWMQGRFVNLFGNSQANDDDPINGNVWRPTVKDDGEISWALSKETTAPAPMNIKGKDGYTPIKGIDYNDGKDGQGVPVGGAANEFLTKVSGENFDTTWKSLMSMFDDLVTEGVYLPKDLVLFDNIKNAPKAYDELGNNEDGYVIQRVVTRQIAILNDALTALQAKMDGPAGMGQLKNDLYDHISDYNNPHRVTPAIIGAVPIATFSDHVQNFSNPHNVTKDQIGLGNVDNTSDENKPISIATQSAIDDLKAKLRIIGDQTASAKYIKNAKWENVSNALEFEFQDGSKLSVTIPITETFQNIRFDSVTKELVITLPNASEHRINVSALIQVYYGSVGNNIQVIIEDDHVVKAAVIPGSIGELEIAQSVNLRGNPTTTTAVVSDRSSKIATTEFVGNQTINNLISYENDRPLSANMGRMLNQKKADTEDVIRLINEMSTTIVVDNLESTSPTAALSANMGRHLDLTKAPRVHTSPSGSTFGRATVSLFGHVRASETDPLMDGTVSRGTDDGRYARADHRHPTDITRASVDSPELTGHPTTPTPPDTSNDKSIANTEWVRKNIMEGARWGISTTAGTTGDKVANLGATDGHTSKFRLLIGATVIIKFNETNLAKNARMNVDNTGMLPIVYQDHPVDPYMIEAGMDHMFVYDGGNWRIINPSLSGSEIFGGSDQAGGFTVAANQMTGYLGYTTEGFGGAGITADGEVNRALITIPFRAKKDGNPKITISNGIDDWAIRMGDNTLIEVQDPVIIHANKASAVVQFTMKSKYPSNSPCSLVIRRPEAFIKVESSQQEVQFVPVQNIGGIPESMPTGSRILLTQFYVMPINATNQTTQWSVRNSGTTGATITNNTLIVDKSGTIVLEVRIKNGASKTTDFVRQFTIKVVAAGLTITRQPEAYTEVALGNITESLSINASAGSEELTYQWYSNSSNTNVGGDIMPGEVNPTMRIPIASIVGTKYYFCEVRVKNDPDGMKTRSTCGQVTVIKKVTSIVIENKPAYILEYASKLLTTKLSPPDSTHKRVTWSTSNKDVAYVSDNGELFSYRTGTATIKATIDGVSDEFELEVKKLINISLIKNIPTEMESGTQIVLNPTFEPANATYQTVEWSAVEKNGNTVELTTNVLRASGSGKIVIRATVRGANGYIYIQDFEIMINAAFVNVTDITLQNLVTWQTVPLYLNRTIIPSNASRQVVLWSIIDDGGTETSIESDILVSKKPGSLKIRATIANGKRTEDFTKDFTITIKEKSASINDISNIPIEIKYGNDTTIVPKFDPAIAENQYTLVYTISTGNNNVKFNTNTNAIEFVKNTHAYGTFNIKLSIEATDKNDSRNVFRKMFDIIISNDVVKVNDILIDGMTERYGVSGYRNSLVGVADIMPDNATYKNIQWSIDPSDSHETNAQIIDNKKIVATNTGTLKLLATIEKALDVKTPFTKVFEIPILPAITKPFVNIVAESSEFVGFPVLDNPTIDPDDVPAYREISVTVKNNIKHKDSAFGVIFEEAGTAECRIHWMLADIPDKDVTIAINEFIPVTNISIASKSFVTSPNTIRHDLNPIITPISASIPSPLNWSIIGENSYNITFDGNTMITRSEIQDDVIIAAKIPNGKGYNQQYYEQFTIHFTKRVFKAISDLTVDNAFFRTTNGERKHDLNVSVTPSDATNSGPISWSVVGANTHNISFEGNKIVTRTEFEDSVDIMATIPDGTAEGINYSKQFTIQFKNDFKPISDITLGNTSFTTTSSIIKHDLNVSVTPSDATNSGPISWSVVGANTHNISFEGNKIVTSEEIDETVTIEATVPNGLSDTSPYSKQFTITFTK